MYTGLTGKVSINNNAVAYISNWSIEDTVELIEISALGERTKGKIAGLRGWTGSAEGAIEFNASNGHKALFDAMHDGDMVKCEFFLNNDVKFEGTALIESLSVDLSAEDKGNISISVSGVDELKYPGSAAKTTKQEVNAYPPKNAEV